jgi:hypothetical protein
MRTVLGLDLGTSSVGWALFEADDNGLPINLIDLGVRHFEEVVEPKSKLPKNAKRRQARGFLHLIGSSDGEGGLQILRSMGLANRLLRNMLRGIFHPEKRRRSA